MRKDIPDIDSKEAKALMEKHKIKSLFMMSKVHGGYNAPYGIGKTDSEENYSAPLFYFRKPKGVSQEDYEDYLKLFKYSFYN